jgi:hypothetical protein
VIAIARTLGRCVISELDMIPTHAAKTPSASKFTQSETFIGTFYVTCKEHFVDALWSKRRGTVFSVNAVNDVVQAA